ncbi:MAG: STY0301 family protein [Acidobacteriota bacterium]
MRAILAILPLGLGLAAMAHAQVTCPAQVNGAKAGLTKTGWKTEKPLGTGKLEHASLFNSDGKQEYELAPDTNRTVGADLVQQWKASDYHQLDLFMRCDYGKAGQIRKLVPIQLKTCEQKLTDWDPKKGLAASVQMACR